MTMADRIQSLRKVKGISQEELADKIGVSRQAISKWESEQSSPDLEKIILLSDYFEVTTDYLLKGIEMKADFPEKSSQDARIFTIAGTACNFVGLVSAITVWVEERMVRSVAIGFIVMAFGCMLGAIGQFVGDNKAQARRWFLGINIWFLILMPASCVFNFVQGKSGGYWWTFSPIPQIGNSLMSYLLFWLFYLVICMSIDVIIVIKNKNDKRHKVA